MTRPSRGPDSPPLDQLVAEWETDAYPALRRHAEIANKTPIDDLLPENPQNHPDELAAALAKLSPRRR